MIALNSLRVGIGIEIGLCIVLIAVVLDKLSLAWANKQTDYFADLTFVQRNRYALLALVVFLVGTALAWIGSFLFKEGFNYLYIVPHQQGYYDCAILAGRGGLGMGHVLLLAQQF